MASRRPHNLRALLAVPSLRRLLAVRLGGQFTDGVFQAALAGSVLFNPDRQATPTAIALAAAALVLPYSLVGPFAGVLLDRSSRRTVIVLANLARAGLVLPIAAMIFLGSEGLLLFVTTLVVIGLGRLLLAGLSAATPHVVSDERLVTANAVAGTAGSVAYSLGLGCALLLLQTAFPVGDTGYAGIAVLTPVGYLACAVGARFSFARYDLGPERAAVDRSGLAGEVAAVVHGMTEGLRHLAQARRAAYAMAAQTGFRLLFGVLALAMLLLYRNQFAGDDLDGVPAQLGLVFAAGAVGVLVAAVATPPMTRRIGGWRWVTLLLAAVAVALPAFGLAFDPLLLVLAVLVVNVAGQGIKIVVDTMVQQECADGFRGRVFAVNDTVFNLAYVLGMAAAAPIIPDNGRSPLLLALSATGFAGLALGYGVLAGRYARVGGGDLTAATKQRRLPY
ncbi:MFS transporter [Micromonospora olivasterospora]|uniref:MFS transporter n=1 Tax=Micromonospora olivasterospora TaxID=1880 RepID=A0A562I327_MICOL|nr:MFS transporter [Micromonospora olivasterospora]TWH65362.1 MFS transporter [Micromonospora olivasterospora]